MSSSGNNIINDGKLLTKVLKYIASKASGERKIYIILKLMKYFLIYKIYSNSTVSMEQLLENASSETICSSRPKGISSLNRGSITSVIIKYSFCFNMRRYSSSWSRGRIHKTICGALANSCCRNWTYGTLAQIMQCTELSPLSFAILKVP